MRRALLAFGALALLVLATVVALPSTIAAEDDSIGKAAREGIGDLIKGFFRSIGEFVSEIFLGFIRGVVKPFFGIFGGFFEGVGTGLKEGSQGLLSSARDAIRGAWESANDMLRPWGVLAPVVVTAIFLGVAWAFVIFITWVIGYSADNFLPAWVERKLKDEDKER